MRSWLLLSVALGAAGSCGADVVSLGEIKGACLATGNQWRLALGGPGDGGVITRACDLELRPGQPVPLVDVPESLSGGEFTVLLELADVAGGLLRLSSPRIAGDVRTVMVSSDGWRAVRFGPAEWEGELALVLEATAPARVTQVTVYRRFDQLFGRAGHVSLVGAACHKLGDDEFLSRPLLPAGYRDPRSGKWRRAPRGREEGVTGARLEKHYQSLLNGPLQDELGLAVPVQAPNGLLLCARMKGSFAFIVYPETAMYILTGQGEADAWRVAEIRCDGAVLDGDGNGVYTGRKKLDWATSRTWTDNYGEGFIDFVAMLPQNEIAVTPPGASRMTLEYESTDGLKKLTIDLAEGTEAVALVNAGTRRTDILLRSESGYAAVDSVDDCARPDCLVVKAGSIAFEQ